VKVWRVKDCPKNGSMREAVSGQQNDDWIGKFEDGDKEKTRGPGEINMPRVPSSPSSTTHVGVQTDSGILTVV
jgi:hypothetical protein